MNELEIMNLMLKSMPVGDPLHYTPAEKVKHILIPVVERAAPENAERRKQDSRKYFDEVFKHWVDENKKVDDFFVYSFYSLVGSVHSDGLYDGMQAGFALHKYGRWLDRQEWLKKVMRVMRDNPGISPGPMCRKLDSPSKRTATRTGKYPEEKATPEGWSNLTWINELSMNRTNVDVLRSKAKKQLESENFKLLSAWYKLNGKDPLSKREPDDDKEFD
jgi:hypothetical protein